MTKEEKIKDAYREWWDKMKNFVDENGWFNKNAFSIINLTYEDVSATVDFIHDESTDEMIPKEIHGIRDNNGWVKIESEADLPKKSTEYWVVLKSGTITKASYLESRKCFFIYGNIEATHYQKVIEPLNPVY